MKDQNVIKKGIVIFSLVVFVLISLVLAYAITLGSREFRDQSVLYGGDQESGYVFVGYLIIEGYRGNSTTGLCGINFLSPRVGLTSAHCVESYTNIYVGKGKMNQVFREEVDIKSVYINPEYKGVQDIFTAGTADLAVIEFKEDIDLQQFATISTPIVGCNYYMVGYGRNEDKIQGDRRGGSICIDQVEGERVLLAKQLNRFFCFGDSGSGIYENGSNRLVAVVSSLNNREDCELATEFYATRVDRNLGFIETYYKLDDVPEEFRNNIDVQQTGSTTINLGFIEFSNPRIFVLILLTICFFLASAILVITAFVITFRLRRQSVK